MPAPAVITSAERASAGGMNLVRTRAARNFTYSIASVSSYRAAAPFVLAIIALLYMSRRRVVTISRTTALGR